MRCPKCKSDSISTVDTRHVDKHNSIRRRKQCLSCLDKWTTYELDNNLLSFFESHIQKLKDLEQRFNGSRNGWSNVWTNSEDNQLINLYYSGVKSREIAEIMKRSYKGIEMRITKLRKLGRL